MASEEVITAKAYEDFDLYCELLVFGFCRTKQDADFAQIEVPMDIIKLCLLWYNPNTINLHCQTLQGDCIPIQINPKDTIFDIKYQIWEKSQISPETQELWQANIGKLLKDDLKVHAYDLHDNDRLRLTLRQQT
eukprot:CAMPEP_0197040454 /NCGR_PEP_ID=MMETSP1384-20130603/17145_1 /TAXON_ID=29189 /ORGANISM="Ammonia sp." /LENGTH=133 /DNA_ID=CAMNT_0042471213 /DNA_START=11 /DNA_END=412 /DNA_ORIENTATION=-